MSSGSSMVGDVVSLADHASAEGGTAPMVREYLTAMRVLGLDADARCGMLRHCQSFFDGTQHDHQGLDWNSMPRDPGVGYMHERLKPQGFVPVNSAYAARKPDTPVPLARQVVSRFTEMLLGEGRHPSVRVASDEATEEFLECAFKDANLWDVMAEARDVAGACGTAGITIGLTSGFITAEVLHPRNLWVGEWDPTAPGWRPRVVVEQYRAAVQVIDTDEGKGKGRLKTIEVWRTRAWTPEEVIYYEDTPCNDIPDDGIPERERVPHKLKVCPVVWYQNTRATDAPDGRPDCQGTWPLLDKLDRLQSQVYKAAVANTDPTLVIKEPRHSRRRNSIIQKGSTGVIALPPDGSAEYMEMTGTSVKVGLEGVNALVSEVLQTVECVVISPEYAKAYQSGEALQILWRSMESRANRLRVTLGAAIQQVCRLLLRMADVHKIANIEDVDTDKDQTGILLSPRMIITDPEIPDEAPEPGAPPAPKPEPAVTWEAHNPGNVNAHVALDWPPYWTPTAQQILASAQAMATATTAKQIISAETATRHLAQMMGHDGDMEVRRLDTEKSEGMATMMKTGALLGGVPDDDDFGDDDDDDDDEDEDGGGGDFGSGEGGDGDE